MTAADAQETSVATDVTFAAHVEEQVGVVELCRPPNNYLDSPLLDGVLAAIDTLVEQGCRAVVLRSQGKHFSAGRDFAAPRLPGDSPQDLYERAASLFASPVPLVAEVQGGAIGAGLGLALVADVRIVSPRAYFWANFARLGTHPGFGLTVTLPDVVGRQRARWMFSAAERVGAETALAWGLADQGASAEELRAVSMERAAQLAAIPPEALAALRRTLRPPEAVESFRMATRHEAAEQARLRQIAASATVSAKPDTASSRARTGDQEPS